MKKLRMYTKVKQVTTLMCSVSVVAILLLPIFARSASADPNIAITSPQQGQEFSGNDIVMSGTSAPNSTILVKKGDTILKQVSSNGSGAWSAGLDGLPDGQNTLTATAIQNSGYAYYTGYADQDTMNINQIRLSDSAINPNPGWPVQTSLLLPAMSSSPKGDVFYLTGFDGRTPAKFDATVPNPVVEEVPDYPAVTGASFGAFNSAGTKYYSVNGAENGSITVVDVATNTVEETFNVPSHWPATARRSPSGLIYIHSSGDEKIDVIDPATNQFVKTIDQGCEHVGGAGGAAFASFSADPNYPYFFAACPAEGLMKKVRLSDDLVVASWNVGGQPFAGTLSLDSKKMYEFEVNANYIKEIDTETGQTTKTIETTDTMIGFVETPDFQRLYVATPGDFQSPTRNIDVYNFVTDTLDHIETEDIPVLVIVSPASVVSASFNLSVVLGVQTTASGSQLAKTGAFVAIASPLGLFLVGAAIYTFTDYHRHKQPLLEADPAVSYSYFHHLRVVSIPLAKYRFSVSVDRRVGGQSDDIHHY